MDNAQPGTIWQFFGEIKKSLFSKVGAGYSGIYRLKNIDTLTGHVKYIYRYKRLPDVTQHIQHIATSNDLKRGFCPEDAFLLGHIYATFSDENAVKKLPSQLEVKERFHMVSPVFLGLCIISYVFLAVSDFLNYRPMYIPLPFGLSTTATTGLIFFPICMAICDIVTEIYGRSCANKMVIGMMLTHGLVASLIYGAVHGFSAPAGNNEIFMQTLSTEFLQAASSSIIAYPLGALLSSALLSRLKAFYDGQYMFMRICIASAVGVSFNCSIFTVLAFWGKHTPTELLGYLGASISQKIVYETLLSILSVFIIIPIIQNYENIISTKNLSNPLPPSA